MQTVKTFRIIFALICLLAVGVLFAQQTYPPAVMYLEPSVGTGTSASFYITSWNYAGGNAIRYMRMRFGDESAAGCNILFDLPLNRVSVSNDGGSTWGTGVTMGSNVAADSNTCGFNGTSTSYVIGGNYATGYVTLNFKSAFAGTHPTWGWASNTANQNSGWIPINSTGWTVPGPQPPTNISITPTSTSDATRTFTIQLTDPAGTGNVDYIQPVLGGWGGCRPLFYPVWNAVYLMTDAGTWGNAVTIGSNTTLENSKCRLNVNATSLYFINSTTMAVNFSVTAKVSPVGDGTTGVFINGNNGLSSGLVTLGTWSPTITTTTDRQSTGTAMLHDVEEYVNDGFNGTQMLSPSLTHPLPALELVTVSGNSVAKQGEPVIIKIYNAKPYTQVWITETSTSQPVNDTNSSWLAGVNMLGGYVGNTDSQGSMVWQTQAGTGPFPYQDRIYQIWVGNWCGNSQQCGFRPDADIIGVVRAWITDASGYPAPPAIMLEPLSH